MCLGKTYVAGLLVTSLFKLGLDSKFYKKFLISEDFPEYMAQEVKKVKLNIMSFINYKY